MASWAETSAGSTREFWGLCSTRAHSVLQKSTPPPPLWQLGLWSFGGRIMRNNNSELLFDQTCGSGGGGRFVDCPLSWQRQTSPSCLITLSPYRGQWFDIDLAWRGRDAHPAYCPSQLCGASSSQEPREGFCASCIFRCCSFAAGCALNVERRLAIRPTHCVASWWSHYFSKPPGLRKTLSISLFMLLFSYSFPSVPTLIVCLVLFFFVFCLAIWEGMCNNAAMRLPVINAAVTENWTGDCGNCASAPLEKLRLLFQLLGHLCAAAVLLIIGRVPSTCLCFCFPGADRGDCFQGAARLHRRRWHHGAQLPVL